MGDKYGVYDTDNIVLLQLRTCTSIDSVAMQGDRGMERSDDYGLYNIELLLILGCKRMVLSMSC